MAATLDFPITFPLWSSTSIPVDSSEFLISSKLQVLAQAKDKPTVHVWVDNDRYTQYPFKLYQYINIVLLFNFQRNLIWHEFVYMHEQKCHAYNATKLYSGLINFNTLFILKNFKDFITERTHPLREMEQTSVWGLW